MNITLTGGGTGGHLFPAIAIAQEFQARDRANNIAFIGSSRGIEARVLPKMGYTLHTVEIKGFKGKNLRDKAGSLRSIPSSVARARRHLQASRADLVVGVGGYISFPAVAAGRLLGLPVVVHEQNSVPGLSNRLLGRCAERIFVTYEESLAFFPRHKTVHTGLPVRRSPGAPPAEHAGPVRTVCVLGGSQGAREINRAIIDALPALAGCGTPLTFIHQTGTQDAEAVAAAYRAHGIRATVAPFYDDMLSCFAESDLVISRAGAGTLAELALCGRPAILIPYPFATADHQKKNAELVARHGAAVLLESAGLNGRSIANQVIGLIQNRERLAAMSDQARRLARPEAAAVIVDECLRLITSKGRGCA